MAKRKRKSRRRKRRGSAALRALRALRQNGLRAFNRGDYNQAIGIWEQLGRQAPNMRPTSALAEAYFRRGLKRLYGRAPDPQAGLSDLQQAAELQPDDPRNAYHLGLAAHRQGDLDGAIRAYQTARQGGGEFAARAAYPLALALLQRGEDPAAAPVWSALSAEERAMLSQAGAFRRRPYTLSSDAPPLWQGMAALDADDREAALTALNRALESPANPAERGMAHYYRGVLAAQDGSSPDSVEADWDEVRRQWDAARAAGLAMPRLAANLGELYHRLAEERLANEDLEGALAAAVEALRHKPGDKRLNQLLSQAHQRLAYQAASAGRWAAARDHWETASEAEGGGFRLAYNLALAYERSEDYLSAGEMWREALRRRPRRADHPDAISDEQVARLWRRAAEAYRKAGEYDEAVRVYKQAVKWNPDNVETRMALSEALLAEGRLQAAENELNRVLERDPDNIPALLRQGEVVDAKGSWWWGRSPTFYWERVLELQPDNLTARQLLANYYQDRAEAVLSWGNYVSAVRMYQRALEYQPKSGRILAALGGCYLRMGDEAAAQSHIEEALANAPADLDVYNELIHAWLDVGEPGQAWRLMEGAEATVDPIPYEFYLSQALYCLQTFQSELARPWAERAVEQAPPGAPVLVVIGETAVMTGAVDMGWEYLERAIAAGEEPGQAYLMLGVLAARDGDHRTADKHWKEAERIAHQNRDGELSERIKMTRLLFSAPPGLIDYLLRGGGGPLGGPPFPDFFDDEYDDDDHDFFD